jgi:hypothetical protein
VRKCCRSSPLCERCPLRLSTDARAHAQRERPARLVEEILRGDARPLPDSVTDALRALALARQRISSRASNGRAPEDAVAKP